MQNKDRSSRQSYLRTLHMLIHILQRQLLRNTYRKMTLLARNFDLLEYDWRYSLTIANRIFLDADIQKRRLQPIQCSIHLKNKIHTITLLWSTIIPSEIVPRRISALMCSTKLWCRDDSISSDPAVKFSYLFWNNKTKI